jgi:erythromycin esterase
MRSYLNKNQFVRTSISRVCKVTLLVFISYSFAANAQSDPIKTDTTLSNKPFVTWAKNNAFPLQDADKAVGYNDLLPIKKMIGNARVVALGEPSHGLHEPQAFRNRLFKYLVEQCGFTTIVLEAGIAESDQATTFIATGNGVPQQAAKNMTIGAASPENIELIQWMREYNTNPLHKNKVKLYGMDIELVGFPGDTISRHASIDIVLNYLKKVDPVSATKIGTELSPYLDRLSVAKYPLLSEQEHDRLSVALDGITALIERERINFIDKSSKDEYNWVHRLAVAAQQRDRLTRVTPPDQHGKMPSDAWILMSTRDAAMADNVLWILNNEADGGKVLLYSHNAHVKNAPTTGSVWDAFARPSNAAGQYLRSALGKDLFILGMSFAPSATRAQPGSVDVALLNVGKPRFMVDLKAAAIDPQIKAWLAVKRPMEANMYTYLNMPIGTAFDALVFLDKSAPKK